MVKCYANTQILFSALASIRPSFCIVAGSFGCMGGASLGGVVRGVVRGCGPDLGWLFGLSGRGVVALDVLLLTPPCDLLLLLKHTPANNTVINGLRSSQPLQILHFECFPRKCRRKCQCKEGKMKTPLTLSLGFLRLEK